MSGELAMTSLLKRLEIEPGVALLIWGDVLERESALSHESRSDDLIRAVYVTAHWLMKYAGLGVHEHVLPTLRRLLPDLKSFAEDYARTKLNQAFNIVVYDYRYVSWTDLQRATPYDVRTLSWCETWQAGDWVTRLELNLPALLKLVTAQGAKDGTPQGSAQSPQATAGG